MVWAYWIPMSYLKKVERKRKIEEESTIVVKKELKKVLVDVWRRTCRSPDRREECSFRDKKGVFVFVRLCGEFCLLTTTDVQYIADCVSGCGLPLCLRFREPARESVADDGMQRNLQQHLADEPRTKRRRYFDLSLLHARRFYGSIASLYVRSAVMLPSASCSTLLPDDVGRSQRHCCCSLRLVLCSAVEQPLCLHIRRLQSGTTQDHRHGFHLLIPRTKLILQKQPKPEYFPLLFQL